MSGSVSSTASVLEAMTAGIMGRKAEKAGLTPVGRESPVTRVTVLPERAPVNFPNDHPVEEIEKAVKAIRREVDFILQACDAIDATNGAPPQPVAPPVDVVKQAERQADAKFAEDYRAKQEAAQAAAFRTITPPSSGMEENSTWRCPEHGTQYVEQLTSKKGRLYGACTKCKEFEH